MNPPFIPENYPDLPDRPPLLKLPYQPPYTHEELMGTPEEAIARELGRKCFEIYMEPMVAASGGLLKPEYHKLCRAERKNWENMAMTCWSRGYDDCREGKV